jgi:hypothetical protein
MFVLSRHSLFRIAPLSAALVVTFAAALRATDERPSDARISTATKDADGFLVHAVESEFQEGQTQIRVLLPDRISARQRYPVVYVLPVEPGRAARYGDGLLSVKANDFQNQYQAIFVEPTFAQVPWFADHPTKPLVRQETYFLQVIVPFIDRTYPTLAETKGRLLLGFSKSGWGAWSLLLRHPELFSRAAAWDAPLYKVRPDQFKMDQVFGTQANFEQYEIAKLLPLRAKELAGSPRLLLLGYGNFHGDHQAIHALLDRQQTAHVYRDGPQRKHEWSSGWLPEAVKLLFDANSPARQTPRDR